MPSWLSDWVGTDMAPLAYYALVAAIVLALIVIVLTIAKKVLGVSAGPKVKGRGPRLAVMDVSAIDQKRKLVLVRRDEVEHLILIGGQNDLVVEAGILRVPASARQGRADPGLGSDADLGAMGAPRAAPQRARPIAGPQGASPLTRPVPRPAAAAAPAVVPPVVAPAPEPAPQEIELERPAPEVETPAAVKNEPRVEIPDVDAPAAASAPQFVPSVEAPAAPKSEAPRPAAPLVTPPAALEAKPPVADVAPAAVEPLAPPPTARPVVPAPATVAPPAAPTPAPPVAAPSPRPAPIPASAMPRPIPRETERPAQPSLSDEAAEAQKRPPVPLPARFTVGGTLEPVQRSGQPQPLQPTPPNQPSQAGQQRSMATPTYPAKPTPAAAELEAKISRPVPEPARREEATVERAPKANVEPSPEEVLARLLAKAKEPVREGPALDLGPSRERAQTAPEPKIDTAASIPNVAAPDAGERRPLSVRSFASAIQGRQSASDLPSPAPAPEAPQTVRREPEIAVPPMPAAPKASTAPVTPSAPAAPVAAPSHAPATAWEDEENDLEDFLSNQLNEQLGEDIWTKESAATVAAPPARTAPPVAPPQSRNDAPPISAPSDASAAAPAKRPLTLEEEMERLLGDFDLETSDRRLR